MTFFDEGRRASSAGGGKLLESDFGKIRKALAETSAALRDSASFLYNFG